MRDHEGVRKCWPFAVEGEEKDVVPEKLLPPTECPRPALWCLGEEGAGGRRRTTKQREGHAGVETETEGELKVRPVCEVFTSSSNNALSAHIDGCLASSGKKSDEQREVPPAPARGGQWRAPKTRSLAEFYAVAPDIVAATTVDDTIEESKAGEEEVIITGKKEVIITNYKKRKRTTRISVKSEYENIKRKKTLKIVKRLIKVCFLLISLFINFDIL